MDLLRYSAVKEQADVIACAPTLAPIAGAINAQAAPLTQSACWFAGKEKITIAPWNTGNWGAISNPPAGVNITPGAANSLCVRDGTTWRIGVCCQFSVPAGASNARFQIWGAGAGSGSGCCCGGSHFGGSGAYASIIIPVTPGDSYTLCAACAVCCYCGWTGPYIAPASYVTGPRLCNFCAEGGVLNHLCWMSCIRPSFPNRISTNCINTSCGPVYCNSGGDFCSTGYGTPHTYGSLTPVAACNTFYGCATNGTPAQGLNGMWGCFCSNTSAVVIATHPPIYGFENVSQCQLQPANSGWVGGAMCYRADNVDFMRYPGAGGSVTNPRGGCNSPNADSGRFGMVCVTWW